MKSTAQIEMAYGSYIRTENRTATKNILSRFMDYCKDQQGNRLLWLAIGLAGHGCFFTIATLSVILLTGNVFALFVIACGAMAAVIITNLAALPTKITIPVLVASLLIDLGVIIAAIALL